MPRVALGLVLLSLLIIGSVVRVAAQGYEVWTIDQADAANGGDRLYIFSPADWSRPIEVVELGARAQGVGDGAGVRPHLLLFNNLHTHALIANVASGHVYVMRASDRSIVASLDVGDQAHGAMPSPDDRWILVANQNGKRLARIRADYAREQFAYERDADLDLGAMEDATHPDNAPICPSMFIGNSGKAYVTLRGGGMYVVDTLATPMRVIRSYGNDQIAPAGCGGIALRDRVYVNSGTPNDSNLYVFDARTDDLLGSMPLTQWGTDAHGMAILGGRYLWMANRGQGDNVIIIDTHSGQVVDTIEPVGAGPDLMDINPVGDRVFVVLRGPRALTGGPAAVGETPGIAVLEVEDDGETGWLIAFIPVGDQSPDTHVDPHAIAVRWLRQ